MQSIILHKNNEILYPLTEPKLNSTKIVEPLLKKRHVDIEILCYTRIGELKCKAAAKQLFKIKNATSITIRLAHYYSTNAASLIKFVSIKLRDFFLIISTLRA